MTPWPCSFGFRNRQRHLGPGQAATLEASDHLEALMTRAATYTKRHHFSPLAGWLQGLLGLLNVGFMNRRIVKKKIICCRSFISLFDDDVVRSLIVRKGVGKNCKIVFEKK